MQISQIRAILAEVFDVTSEPGTSDALHAHGITPNEGIDTASTDAPHHLLYAYIDAELEGEDVSVKYPQLHDKLQSNGELWNEYCVLRDLLAAERGEQLEAPPFHALFDFSYLSQTSVPEPKRPWLLAELGRVVIQFSNELINSWQPSAALSAVKSGDEDGGIALFQYELQNQIEDVDVEIVARTSRNNSDLCNVSVFIDVPSRNGWPNLSGSEVKMYRDREIADTQTTDAFGKVLFTNVRVSELPNLKFEITPVGSDTCG